MLESLVPALLGLRASDLCDPEMMMSSFMPRSPLAFACIQVILSRPTIKPKPKPPPQGGLERIETLLMIVHSILHLVHVELKRLDLLNQRVEVTL